MRQPSRSLVVVLAPLLMAAMALAACGDAPQVTPVDMGPARPVELALSLKLTAPSLDGLAVTGGELALTRVGVFGDVPADARTTLRRVEFALPSDEGSVPFQDAPYGLYSRAFAHIDEVEVRGTWRDIPLVVDFEVEYLDVDLRAPPVEYSPTAGATLAVVIDMNTWFSAEHLDEAAIEGGFLRIDGRRNTGIAVGIARAIADSFSMTSE